MNIYHLIAPEIHTGFKYRRVTQPFVCVCVVISRPLLVLVIFLLAFVCSCHFSFGHCLFLSFFFWPLFVLRCTTSNYSISIIKPFMSLYQRRFIQCFSRNFYVHRCIILRNNPTSNSYLHHNDNPQEVLLIITNIIYSQNTLYCCLYYALLNVLLLLYVKVDLPNTCFMVILFVLWFDNITISQIKTKFKG